MSETRFQIYSTLSGKRIGRKHSYSSARSAQTALTVLKSAMSSAKPDIRTVTVTVSGASA